MSKLSKDKQLFKKYFTDGCQPSPPDERDYSPAMVCLAGTLLPEEYLCTGMKVLNQGSVGSCVAHACSTALGYGEKKSGMNNAHDFSRGYIYGNRKDSDYQGEGMYLRQALKQLNHCGDCEYTDFPYNETYPQVKSRISAQKEALAAKAEPYKILNYFRCYTNEEVKRALLNQGSVVISIPVYSSFAADCPIPKSTDTLKGGHAMCVIGWDKTGWIIQNSWSSTWGKKGTMHLPYEYPIYEFWGMTVNPNVPQPEKKVWYVEFLQAIFAFIKRLFRK